MAVRGWVWLGLVTTLGAGCAPAQDSPAVSSESETCVSCHELANPGLVADWRASRHARRSVAQALAEPALARRVSAEQVPAAMAGVVVCCLECHGQDPDSHADSFEHFGYRIHTVVTPRDCATCHPQEVEQYGRSKKAAARANLLENPVYHGLVEATTRRQSFVNGTLTPGESTLEAKAESCLACHGTQVEVTGTRTVETALGDLELPVLSGWPNQGVGRENPDGSLGSCAPCHARHSFDLASPVRPRPAPSATSNRICRLGRSTAKANTATCSWPIASGRTWTRCPGAPARTSPRRPARRATTACWSMAKAKC